MNLVKWFGRWDTVDSGARKEGFNDKLVNVVRAVAGSEGLRLAKVLARHKAVSEGRIARFARLDVQVARRLLYRLHSSNLATYKLVRDKGEYVSFWSLNADMIRHNFLRIRKEELERFKERLAAENSSYFFACPSACNRVDFAAAMQQGFRCEECGKILIQVDNHKTIGFLKEKIREIEFTAN